MTWWRAVRVILMVLGGFLLLGVGLALWAILPSCF